MDSTKPLDSFDLAPREDKFTRGQRKLILREASEGAAIKFRQASLAGAEMAFDDNTGERRVKKLGAAAEVETLLVSLCLYEADENHELVLLPNGDPDPKRLISRKELDSWPARHVKPIFERCKEISDLNEVDNLPDLRRQADRIAKRIAKLEAQEAKPGQEEGN